MFEIVTLCMHAVVFNVFEQLFSVSIYGAYYTRSCVCRDYFNKSTTGLNTSLSVLFLAVFVISFLSLSILSVNEQIVAGPCCITRARS